jgi:hypothetical protein
MRRRRHHIERTNSGRRRPRFRPKKGGAVSRCPTSKVLTCSLPAHSPSPIGFCGLCRSTPVGSIETARCPHSLIASLATLHSMSLIPFAPFASTAFEIQIEVSLSNPRRQQILLPCPGSGSPFHAGFEGQDGRQFCMTGSNSAVKSRLNHSEQAAVMEVAH